MLSLQKSHSNSEGRSALSFISKALWRVKNIHSKNSLTNYWKQYIYFTSTGSLDLRGGAKDCIVHLNYL